MTCELGASDFHLIYLLTGLIKVVHDSTAFGIEPLFFSEAFMIYFSVSKGGL